MISARELPAATGGSGIDEARPRPSGTLANQLDLLLASGGGPAIWPDVASGRTHLGTGPRPLPTELWFGSTAGNNIGLRGYHAALDTLRRLIGSEADALSPTRWLDQLRRRIATSIAATPDCAVIFAPTPAEARDLARSIAAVTTQRFVHEIAAVGGECEAFRPAQDDRFATTEIPLRDARGDRRGQAQIDMDVRTVVAEALGDSNGVLLHLLDTSKTGLRGPSRRMARSLANIAPDRVCVLVDACELRCTPATVAEDLSQGWMVLVSGSHFAGGPTHCAALLLPRALADALATGPAVLAPGGIARCDVPAELRPVIVLEAGGLLNLGLGLRWTASLAEYEAFLAMPELLRLTILSAFTRKARRLAGLCTGVDPEARLIDDEDDPLRDSIVPLILDCRADASEAFGVRTALAAPCGVSVGDVTCHVGLPVSVGSCAALPVSISAATVADVGERMTRGLTFQRAFAPLLRDLGSLFGKLDRVQAEF